MKFLLCLAFAFIIVSSSANEFLSKNLKDSKGDASIVIEHIWSHFGLEKPEQILRCLDNCKSDLLYKELSIIDDVIEDSRDRKGWAAHLDFGKLVLVNKALESTWACISLTQDFTDLLDALKIDERNPDFFEIALYLYYQAFYPRLADDIQPIVSAFKANDWNQAGDLLGGFIDSMVKEIDDDGFAFQGLASYLNGASSELNIDFPQDSLKCHNETSAHAIMKFLWKLSSKVSQGSAKESLLNTYTYWHEDGGKDLIESIPLDIVECHMNSQDVSKLSDRLKIRVGSQGFRDALLNFISKKPYLYWSTMKAINHSFAHHNFVHAGYSWGHFLDRLSKSLPYHDETETLSV